MCNKNVKNKCMNPDKFVEGEKQNSALFLPKNFKE
jgi:hypothetical protein